MSAALEQKVGEPEAELTDGFHLVIDALKLNGIKTIYNVPGIPITDLGRLAQAEGMRVISFRHEQNAGNAAAIAGFLTKSPGVCLTVSAPGFLNGLVALANATTNCFPMILISGSSEREIVDLQQGDYEEMDQLAVAKPLCKAAFRVLHAADIGIGVARAIRAAVSGRPGGVYLDLPAKLFGQVMEAEAGRRSLVKVIDPAPAQIPAPSAVERALDVLRGAKRPLIILGKGAAYAQADDDIRALVEKSGIPYIPMSMAKGLLPDTASAMRRRRALDRAGRQRRRDDDRRAAQLAAQSRQGQAVGASRARRSSSRSTSSRARWTATSRSPHRWWAISAPAWPRCCAAWATTGSSRRRSGRRRSTTKKEHQHRPDGDQARQELDPDGLPLRAARAARRDQGAAGRDPGERGCEHARPGPRRDRHVSAAQAPRCRHLGRDGHRHGLCHRRGDRDRQAGTRHRGRQRVRLLRHGGGDDLPLQPAGLRRRVQQRRHLSRRWRQSERRRRSRPRPCSSRAPATTG